MTTMVITTRITHRYLMNKTKDELAFWLLEKMKIEEILLEENKKLKEELYKWQSGNLGLKSTMFSDYAKDSK